MSNKLLREIRACRHCRSNLPLPPRPVLNFSARSRIILIGQAPGLKVHESGVPWNDASGQRLREWLAVSADDFYDVNTFGIVPMGFCYPGNSGRGDLPPRPECAELWMTKILTALKKRHLLVLIGQYAQKYFLGDTRASNLTETVRNWQHYLPEYFVLPHPSPRNNIWLKKNPWFETEVLPALRKSIHG